MTPFQQKQLTLMRQMETRLASNANAATIVSLQTNYATDTQLCLSANCFLSNDVANTIQTKIIEPLQRLDPTQYYYANESLHITLHSIRVIHDPPSYTLSDIETSKQLLTKLVPVQNAFPVVLHGIISMPTSVAIIVLITPEYDHFIRNLRTEFVNAGIPDDKKYFTDEIVFANTTICRYTHKPSQEFLHKIEMLNNINIESFIINDVSLVETNAGCHPSKTRDFGTYKFRKI